MSYAPPPPPFGEPDPWPVPRASPPGWDVPLGGGQPVGPPERPTAFRVTAPRRRPAPSRPPRRGRSRAWLALLLGLLIGFGAVAGGYLVVKLGAGGAEPTAEPSDDQSAEAPRPPVTAADYVIHAGTKFAFIRLPGAWRAATDFRYDEIRQPVGQVVEVERGYFASVFIGELNREAVRYAGPAGLATTTEALVRAIEKRYYPVGARRNAPTEAGPLQVDGHAGYIVRFHLSFAVPGVTAKGEAVAVAVVDVGGGRAAAFWGSVPDTRPDLLPQLDNAANGLRFAI